MIKTLDIGISAQQEPVIMGMTCPAVSTVIVWLSAWCYAVILMMIGLFLAIATSLFAVGGAMILRDLAFLTA